MRKNSPAVLALRGVLAILFVGGGLYLWVFAIGWSMAYITGTSIFAHMDNLRDNLSPALIPFGESAAESRAIVQRSAVGFFLNIVVLAALGAPGLTVLARCGRTIAGTDTSDAKDPEKKPGTARPRVKESDGPRKGDARLGKAPSGQQGDLDRRWREALKLHDTLDGRWHRYETDLQAILDRPLMRDLSHPVVATAVRAMAEARNLREEKPPVLQSGERIADVADYLNAVSRYEIALEAAERKAAGSNDFMNSGEQRRLELARRLLATASDAGATEAVRQTAYDRVVKVVNELRMLAVPRQVFDSLALEAGVSARAALTA